MTLLTDTLTQFRSRLEEVEQQLSPLEREAQELRDAIERLQPKRSTATPSAPRTARRSTSKRSTTGNGRARRGATRATVLEAALANPGATSGEIAAITGVARPTVATTMSKLRTSGDLPRPAK